MRKVLLAVAVVSLITGTGYAAGAAQTTSSKPKATTMAKADTAAKTPKAMSATGKIVSFDEASHTLVLATSKGQEQFMLGPSARLQEGAKTIAATNLSTLAGHEAKVRYTESGTTKSAESVMVSGGAGAKPKK